MTSEPLRRAILPGARYAAIFAAALLALASGCCHLKLDSARALGAEGAGLAGRSARYLVASAEEVGRALDAEAFFHGYAGTNAPPELRAGFRAVQAELAARRRVFAELEQAYDAFSGLASESLSGGLGDAAARLGDAVNGYAAALGRRAPLAPAEKDALNRLAARGAATLQKRRVREASAQLRLRLEALAGLLEDPLVRTQLTSFKENLSASRATAVQILWERGLLDPSPLMSQLGESAGLKAGKDAAKMLQEPKNRFVRDGLSAVVAGRLERGLEQIARSYDAQAKAVRALAGWHRELESGEVLCETRLRLARAELEAASTSLTPPGSDEK